MALIDDVNGPRDLRSLSGRELATLAAEIRAFLVGRVSRTGGHLGPNLGVVELTMAVHRVFDSPHDPIIFDTGHQSYVHKILTGRRELFPTLRQVGGLSGYPAREESPHDWVENSHATPSLSWAAGLAKAFQLSGEDRTVVVVIGDGALTGGMAWEAMNNIAVEPGLKLVMVVNDNGRSYTPTVGGVASHLAKLRTDRRYEETLRAIKRRVQAAPVIGEGVYDLMHGFKTGVKDILAPQGLFSDLGLKYVGPVDGHDTASLEHALEAAKHFGGPVIVHCMTEKGRGFAAAEADEADRFHAVGSLDTDTGQPLNANPRRTWTDAFRDEIALIAAENPAVVGVTAAMPHPTGLDRFAREFPGRVLDVGIAEQHAITMAAGLARGGLHPVVALYSTFLNRAFDQLLMDVALHGEGVTMVLDRSGITGPDGPSHHGMWDTSLATLVPGLRLAAPRDEVRLIAALRKAVTVADAPTVVRYSKEPLPEVLEATGSRGSVDLLADAADARVLLVGYGAFAALGLQVADRVARQGIAIRVVDPVWALPVADDLLALCAEHDVVVTLEDGGVVGGLGAHLAGRCRQAGVPARVHPLGIPQEFIGQGSRGEVLERIGLSAKELARTVVDLVLAADESRSLPEVGAGRGEPSAKA
ncbi:MAG: 1-deoxy-D-xylulose-5-phosphate synthase [Propioniciclava sp.]